jgi:hypothetical protein
MEPINPEGDNPEDRSNDVNCTGNAANPEAEEIDDAHGEGGEGASFLRREEVREMVAALL